jgi:hypothetical protein
MPGIVSFDANSDQSIATLNGVQDYIANARKILQDIVPAYRYPDADLLDALNIVLLEADKMRGDLFVFNVAYNSRPPSFSGVDGTYVPIEAQFRPSILAGVIGHALLRSQEDSQDAAGYLALFVAGLTGRALPSVSAGSGGPRGQQQ